MAGEAAKSVSKTIGVLSATKVLTWISGSALMFVLPRFLGPDEYGKLFLGTSVVATLAIVVDFGREYSVAKEVSRRPDEAAGTVVNAASARMPIGILAYIGLYVFAKVAHYPPDVVMVLLILGGGLLWRGVNSVLWSFFQGVEQMKYPSYGGVVESFMLAVLSIGALMIGTNAVGLAGIFLFCGFVNLILCTSFARKLLPVLPRPNWQEAGRLLKQGVPYFLNTLFGVIYYRVDTVMLSLMTTETVVGWYGASYRFFDILMFLPSIFSISVFPVLARNWKDADALARMTRKSLDFILLAGIPISVGAFAFAPQIIDLVFGLKGYTPSILLLRIFGAGMLLVYIDMVLGMTLLAADKQKQLSVSAFLAIFVNVGLNLWLIPYAQRRFGNGGIGAAIATVATEYFVMITMIIMMPPLLLRRGTVGVQMKIVASGGVMILSVWLMNLAGVPWIVNAIVCSCAYVGSIFALKAIDTSDLALLESALPFGKLRGLIRKKQ